MHEIERKFLVFSEDFKKGLKPVHVIQGYLLYAEDGTARVRIVDGKSAVLSVKKDITSITRWEFEYEIPLKDAELMIKELCNDRVVEKYRYYPEYKGKIWDVDEFAGANAGLIVAEIELGSEEELYDKPAWAGEEVTHDKRYLNASLAEFPYQEW